MGGTRYRWAVALVVGVLGLEVAWLQWDLGGARATQAFSDLISVFTPLIATAACWMTSRIEERQSARRAWVLLGLATASWGIGQAVWSWYELVADREVPFPSLADFGYLGLIPLAAMALLAFPGVSEPRRRELRTLLDGMLIGGSVLFLSWATVLGPQYRSTTGGLLQQVLTLAYPLGDVVLVAAVVFVTARAPSEGRMSFGMLGAGLVALGVADSLFSLLTLNEATPRAA